MIFKLQTAMDNGLIKGSKVDSLGRRHSGTRGQKNLATKEFWDKFKAEIDQIRSSKLAIENR